jgi:aspartyl-tRNA(Asn)/glutamyl-tRNA(Gln) amidotransferase subunit A
MIEIMGGGKTDLKSLPTPSDLKFAVVETMVFDDCDAIQLSAFDQAVLNIKKAGAKIERIKAPAFADSSALGPELFPFEAWQSWGELIEANPGKTYGPVEQRFLQGKSVTEEQYQQAWAKLKTIRSAFFASIEDYDGVLMPTVAIQPPRVEDLLADEALFTSVNLLALRNTRFVNLLGSCALTLPTATYAAGLQIMGNPNDDHRVMQIGQALEAIISA